MNARSLAITRAVAIIGGTGALIVGATFAAGTDVGDVSLTGNTLTASAGLQISADNTTYGTTLTGFSFGTLSPGNTTADTTHKFFLKNTTSGAVTLTDVASNVTGFSHMNKSKVEVHVMKDGGTVGTDDVVCKLQDLINGTPVCTITPPPGAGLSQEYDAWVTLDPGALNSGFATDTGGFDLDFTATQ